CLVPVCPVLATGNPDEAAAILSEALSAGNADLAQRLTEVLKPPMNDGQATMLAWSWMVKGRSEEALTALAQCGSEVSEVSTIRRQIIGKGGASSMLSSCTNFNSIIIPDSVTSIEWNAFASCPTLTSVKFKGNGPISTGPSVFLDSTPTIYRLSTATGWGDTFAGRPVMLWDE
ncbi:MAG TPA: hypothetical protein DCS43_16595, partial [Verrucomicrobia bacterium]|nr:hypothetical protein [Verrucomicrobiota bacterium]